MTAYLIRHKGAQRGDMLIEDGALTLTFSGNWAIFNDADGPTFAVSTEQAASIERVDPEDQEPAPEG